MVAPKLCIASSGLLNKSLPYFKLRSLILVFNSLAFFCVFLGSWSKNLRASAESFNVSLILGACI